MGGASELTLERVINDSRKDKGFRREKDLELHLWKEASGLNLTAATTPGLQTFLTNDVTVDWAAASAVTVKATTKFRMPRDFAPRTDSPVAAERQDIQLEVVARKKEATDVAGAGGATLGMTCQVYWWKPGTDTALNSLTTPVTKTFPAFVADNTADGSGFSALSFDIGAELRAESKTISPGDEVRIVLAPTATTGAGVTMQMSSATFIYRAHAAFTDLTQR